MNENKTTKIERTAEGTWILRNYEIANTQARFEMLVFDAQEETITGYIFADSKKELDALTKVINDNIGANNYVDYCYLVVMNQDLLKTADIVFKFWKANPIDNFNVGLCYLDSQTNGLSKIATSLAKNRHFLFTNYVKPLEIQKILQLINVHNKVDAIDHLPSSIIRTNLDQDLKNSFEEYDKNTPDWLRDVSTKEVKSDLQPNFPSHVPKDFKIDLENNSYEKTTKDLDQKVNQLTEEIKDLNYSQSSLIEEIDKYKENINTNSRLANDLKNLNFNLKDYGVSNTDLLNDLRELKKQNDFATDPLVYDPSLSTNDLDLDLADDLSTYHDQLLNDSNYYQKLNSITNDLKSHDFSEETNRILDELEHNKD